MASGVEFFLSPVIDNAHKTSTDPNPESSQSERKENFLVQAARYSQLAFVFPAALVVGWLIGGALDRWLHTTWLYLAGILLGIAAGFIQLIRAVLRDTK